MKEYIKVVAIVPGIAFGTICVNGKNKKTSEKQCGPIDVENELSRLRHALQLASQELRALQSKAQESLGTGDADIFSVQEMLLDDPELIRPIEAMIQEQECNAADAVLRTGDGIAERLASLEDACLRERAADVRDVVTRLARILNKKEDDAAYTKMRQSQEAGTVRAGSQTGAASAGGKAVAKPCPVIFAAKELLPSEMMQLDREQVCGIVVQDGSAQSHTALLAKSMDIPMVCGVELCAEWDGKYAVLDGENGSLCIEPDENTLEDMRKKQKEIIARKAELKVRMKIRDVADVTTDGKPIRLYANISSPKETAFALENGARGIGLFRSEGLYLAAGGFPGEQDQLDAYRKVLLQMGERPVIVRTWDVGSDKQLSDQGAIQEKNPALGCRGIRFCLKYPKIFKTQLRALYQAGVYGNLSIMLPMVTSVDEVHQTKALIRQVKDELHKEQLLFCENVGLGIMIETPAAAIISASLAKEVDFFSIGSNDLAQYTLALDRMDASVDAYRAAHPEAVLELIRVTVENAHKAGIWAGICGDIASDPAWMERLLSLGVDEFSVPPSVLLLLRKTLQASHL